VSAYDASSIASLKPASTLSRLLGWGSVSGKSSPVSGTARLARTFRATTGALGEKGAQKAGESSKLTMRQCGSSWKCWRSFKRLGRTRMLSFRLSKFECTETEDDGVTYIRIFSQLRREAGHVDIPLHDGLTIVIR